MKLSHKLSLLSVGVLSLACFASTAKAEDFSLHLLPSMEVPITSRQSGIYNAGLSLNAEGLFALSPNFAVGPAIQTTYLSRQVDAGNAGVLWQFGGTARLQGNRSLRRNPSDLSDRSNFSPWLEGTLSYARTGDLNRPAIGLRIGYDAFTDDAHVASNGPFFGFTHVFQTSTTDGGSALLDSRDYNSAQIGWAFSFDLPVHRVVKNNYVQTVRVVEHRVPVVAGCGTCQKAPEKVEFSERVYFNWDSSVLRWEETDKLDALVKKLNEHPTFAVKVQGHASSDGQFEHNVRLAAHRTTAVVKYLTDHGVDGKRLTFESFGSENPSASNTHQEGRERNRRVEFVVDFSMSSDIPATR